MLVIVLTSYAENERTIIVRASASSSCQTECNCTGRCEQLSTFHQWFLIL